MNILIGILSMFPLQNVNNVRDFAFKKSAPNPNAIYFVIGIGVLVVVLIIVNLVKGSSKMPTIKGTNTASGSPRQFSMLTLYRLTSGLGLDRDQSKMLEFVLRSDSVTDPARSLNSSSLLDRHFKRAYRLIERTSISEDELNHRLATLFSTRNVIETSLSMSDTTSTRQIPENAAAVLTVGQTNYPVRVISSRGDTLVVENPTSAIGSPLHLARGSKVSLAFFTKSSKGFSVESRVMGSTDTADGPVLQLVHSGQIKRLSNRRFRRRQTVISTSFYCVHVEETGRKNERKMVVDKRKFSGNILDISIGGCSIKASSPLGIGQRLKIEFTREDNSIVVALGEVLRTTKAGVSTIMNIKFLKVPRKSLNSINAMVYEYAE
ncbi:MAG: PilZ domain-containing protein [Treponema sp.]|jgi:c-di-GMP-binding flagellar brake protein YcgR|nr:PilZ domain-containing protein [Treponema sp.]